MYCTLCGKQMTIYASRDVVEVSYDMNTGDKITIKYVNTTYRCPEYIEGYSDHEWHLHDRITVKETESKTIERKKHHDNS